MTNSETQRVSLRPYEPADAAATLSIFTDAITQTAAAFYSADQVDAWAKPGRRSPGTWHVAMAGRVSVVAVIGSEVVGFSDIDGNGYIDMLFVAPRYVRRGVARTLLGFLEQRAQEAWTSELTSNVSVAARPFFESIGFEVVREQRPVIDGIEMTNYRMTKAVSPTNATVR